MTDPSLADTAPPLVMRLTTPRVFLVLAAMASSLMAGCNRDRGPQESQVAVRVNKGEVSVHQVQALLQRQPRLVAAAGDAAAGRVLEVLVDQELAAQAAREQGLDSDPNVIQTLEAVRREALARAFQERVASRVSSPSSDEIDRYYDSRPALFAQRRLYLLQETAVEASAAQLSRLAGLVQATRSADELTRALRDAGLRQSARQVAQAAEDLPMAVLDAVSNVGPGQSVVLQQPGGARIYTIVQALPAPIDRRTANDAIANFLVADRKRQAVSEAQKALREKAKIEYVGAFAARAASSPAVPAPAASVPQ